MKQFATMLAFSVTSLVALGNSASTTPVDVIPEADKIELFFSSKTSLEYLHGVQEALAARDIQLDITNISYDDSGKLTKLGLELKQHGIVEASTQADITDQAGAYVFVKF